MKIIKLAPGARLAPPKNLNRKEKAQWREIVNSLPSDHFIPSDTPMLSCYCMMAIRIADLAGMVAADPQDFAAGRMHVKTIAVLSMLATKLRLCVNSRTRSNSTRQLQGKSTTRPWDRT